MLEFVRVEIIVYGRGRNGVRGWTFANRTFLLAKACRQLKWNGRDVVGVSDKSV